MLRREVMTSEERRDERSRYGRELPAGEFRSLGVAAGGVCMLVITVNESVVNREELSNLQSCDDNVVRTIDVCFECRIDYAHLFGQRTNNRTALSTCMSCPFQWHN